MMLQNAWAWFASRPRWMQIAIVLIVVYVVLSALNVQVPGVPGLHEPGSPHN